MSPRAVAFVVCRLFALYLCLNYALSYLISAAFKADLSHASLRGLAVNLGAAGIYIAIGYALWSGASWISQRIGGSNGADIPTTAQTMTFNDWQALAIAAVGWLTAVFVLRSLIHDLRSDAVTNGNISIGTILLPHLILFGLSALLILLPSKITGGLNRLRAWGGARVIEDTKP